MNKFVFLLFGVLAIFVLESQTVYSSSSICNSGYAEGVCCSQYSSDFRWASGNGMCCGSMSYYGASVCPASEVSCSGVSCPSGCGAGNVVRQNGWCSLGECSYYTSDCDSLDSCVGDDYVNYGCGGGSCVATTTPCTGCNCVNDSGVQQTCGGFNTEEKLLNKNCFDGKDNDCDGFCDSKGCDGKPRDPNCGLLIESIQDIKDNCLYDSSKKLYTCSDWDNIIITKDITFHENIIFEAKNAFIAKNYYATGNTAVSDGTGKSLIVNAKTITATSLNAYGAYCNNGAGCLSCGTPCTTNSGGLITLNAKIIDLKTLNVNDGTSRGGRGGRIIVTGDILKVDSVLSAGSGPAYEAVSGSGGQITINVKNATIGTVNLNGASQYQDYCSGTSGGSLKISADNLSLGNVYSSGGAKGGSGGSTKIYADNFIIGSIIETGAGAHHSKAHGWCGYPGNGGFIGLFSDSNYSIKNLNFNVAGAATYYCNYCRDCCWTAHGKDGIIHLGKRTGSGFFVFNTTIPDSYKSYHIRIKDYLTNEYAKSIYGDIYEQYGFIDGDKISSFVGRNTPYLMKLGKRYVLLMNVSDEMQYNSTNCGVSAQCDEFEIPYTEY